MRFYAFDQGNGRLYVSTNGATGFSATGPAFPTLANNPGGGNEDVILRAAPGGEGDLWLGSRNDGLHHSTNGGVSFAKLADVQEVYSLGFGMAAPGQNGPALFLAGKVGGLQALFRSDDAGKNWVRINDDQHQFGWLKDVTGDPRIFGRVYFATGGRGVIYGDPAAAAE
jgi:photosystem II stability/assembly factor-like uncharacterized protein